jgi:phosphopantothenoylcysteine decarboxylase/phosphopantothenate--cysteine ligase
MLVVPAMNTTMLQHVTVQQNLETLRGRGVGIMEPDRGLLACGDEGAGRMPDPPVIAARVREFFGPRDLEGMRVLVTAGPTREPIDPVRYLTNRSSGKMGYALADAARRRGAEVTLISGPTSLTQPYGVSVVRVETASEMHAAVMNAIATHQIVIKAAAVADYAPVSVADHKIKKETSGDSLTLALRKNPDILADIARQEVRPFVVAFAAETEELEQHAKDKLRRKGADLIVAGRILDLVVERRAAARGE